MQAAILGGKDDAISTSEVTICVELNLHLACMLTTQHRTAMPAARISKFAIEHTASLPLIQWRIGLDCTTSIPFPKYKDEIGHKS